jgi:hypothetical protein
MQNHHLCRSRTIRSKSFYNYMHAHYNVYLNKQDTHSRCKTTNLIFVKLVQNENIHSNLSCICQYFLYIHVNYLFVGRSPYVVGKDTPSSLVKSLYTVYDTYSTVIFVFGTCIHMLYKRNTWQIK